MKTFFISQGLWELVEYGFVDLTDTNEEADARLKETKQKDAKALFFIQQAVHETIFSRIAAATTSLEAWQILKKEFQGSSKVITVKLQTYRHDFETLSMKGNESVQVYLSRVSSLVNQMKSYGENISEEIVVAKVLRSLTPKFKHIVAEIEEAHDLSYYSFDELMKKALQVKGEVEQKDTKENFSGRSRHRGGFHGRGREKTNEESKLFMALFYEKDASNDVWFLDSGCSNHMFGTTSLFKEIDESKKSEVTLRDNKKLKVEGKGIVSITTSQGTAKILQDVVFVPSLSHNLLSIRQLMFSGYSVLFDDGFCTIKDQTEQVIAKV
ncbi:hypothetical protein K2173_010843 [Erythroxylum novogranatense]|uniref:Retrovirus-related Pol polyprotein from transposon TNT 1-94-like beta-barrel domain-containing protein n=1 Tax=Erythroxylum novogranatense TaxID=1862640 RepID=A0AAV8SZT9_9ROSI|nr:hypothetical protein K2173_010843 [Erythroxylum novogranatense]